MEQWTILKRREITLTIRQNCVVVQTVRRCTDCLGKKGVPRSWMYPSRQSSLGMLLELLMRWWLERPSNAYTSAPWFYYQIH